MHSQTLSTRDVRRVSAVQEPDYPEVSTDQTKSLSVSQFDELVRLINVSRAIAAFDCLRAGQDNGAHRDCLRGIAAAIPDARIDQVLEGTLTSNRSLSAEEASGLVAELVLHQRVKNPASEKNIVERTRLNKQQDAVLSAIDHVARSIPAEIAAVLTTASAGLNRSLIPVATEEFISVSGEHYSKLLSGPATTCTCVDQQREYMLKEAAIAACQLCPDCRNGQQSVCIEREQTAFLKMQVFPRCDVCRDKVNRLNGIQGNLLTGLADVMLPIVWGVTELLNNRGGRRSQGLRQTDPDKPAATVVNLATMVAANLLYGTCHCEHDARRMRRGRKRGETHFNCGPEHSLMGWDDSISSLLRFIYVAATNAKGDAKTEIEFIMPFVPSELKAFTYTQVMEYQKAVPKGMVTRIVGPHLAPPGKTPPTRYQVYNILKCQSCNDTVGLNNQCKCTREANNAWPDTRKSPEPILDAEGARSGVFLDTNEEIRAYRVLPNELAEHCIHKVDQGETKLVDRNAPFLFPAAGKSCPCCGKEMKGDSAHVELPISELVALSQRSSVRQVKHADEDAPETEVFEGHLGLRSAKVKSTPKNEVDYQESDLSDASSTLPDEGDLPLPEISIDTLVPSLIRMVQEKHKRKNKALNQFCEKILQHWQDGNEGASAPFTLRDLASQWENLKYGDRKKIENCIDELL